MIGNYNYGTGRRKSSVARVFIKRGTGAIVINGRSIDEYFQRETGRMIARQPLALTNHISTFDVQVNVHGGGESGRRPCPLEVARQESAQEVVIGHGARVGAVPAAGWCARRAPHAAGLTRGWPQTRLAAHAASAPRTTFRKRAG